MSMGYNIIVIIILSIVFSIISSTADIFFIRNVDYQIANGYKVNPTWVNFWYFKLREFSPFTYMWAYYLLFSLPIYIPMVLLFYCNRNIKFVNVFYKNNLYFFINIIFMLFVFVFAYKYYIDIIFGKVPPIEKNVDEYINYVD